MGPNHCAFDANSIIPKPNVEALTEALNNGRIDIATAIGQLGLFMRETLKILEEFATEQVKLNLERKSKVDKMDKIIHELSEKVQVMQQAMLYKDEKYDEKSREVERYKVICELSANAAVSDNDYLTSYDENNNGGGENYEDYREDNVKLEDDQAEMPPPKPSGTVTRSYRPHTKLSQDQIHLSHYVDALGPESLRTFRTESLYESNGDDSRKAMAHYYVGGPSKRRLTSSNSSSARGFDARIKERMEIIGGVNVRGPRVNCGPVSSDRLVQRPNYDSHTEDPSKKVKIDMMSQSNEIMSSSGTTASQMKQKIVERDLHKQVAGGSWTRLASRRKKQWPF